MCSVQCTVATSRRYGRKKCRQPETNMRPQLRRAGRTHHSRGAGVLQALGVDFTDLNRLFYLTLGFEKYSYLSSPASFVSFFNLVILPLKPV